MFNLIRQKSSTSKVGDEGGSGEFTIREEARRISA